MSKIKQLQEYLRWFWLVAKRYWVSAERWRALGLLALGMLFIILAENISVLLNKYQGKLTDTLTNKQVEDFQQSLIFFGLTLLALIVVWVLRNITQSKLELYWREWLTKDFLDRYFGDRAFYRINGNKSIDNPDQRISEDIESFIEQFLTYSLSLGSTILRGFLFISILWNINSKLVFIAIATAIAQTLVSFLIGRILTPLNFKTLQYQADFRYSLVHVRNHSESIAFYEGEDQEKKLVNTRFSRLLGVLHAKILPSSFLISINVGLTFIVFIVAYLILAPQYFSGQVTIGDVTRSIGAFTTIVGVFGWFAQSFQGLTLFAAVIKRLGTFTDYLEHPQNLTSSEEVINTVVSSRLALSHLTVKTPEDKRLLVENLSAEVPENEGILIMGPSGSGKSSILRAVAGLWNQGNGYIYRPAIHEILFIPQRPYIVLGSLRNQLLYPHTSRDITESQLQSVLEKVNLGDLATRVGGFNSELNWADVLSLGEQQRLGFARLFLSNPRYAVLDESTSALDVENEKHLYGLLRQGDITYISVGHRLTLIPYHQKVLEILGGGKWRIFQAS